MIVVVAVIVIAAFVLAGWAGLRVSKPAGERRSFRVIASDTKDGIGDFFRALGDLDLPAWFDGDDDGGWWDFDGD